MTTRPPAQENETLLEIDRLTVRAQRPGAPDLTLLHDVALTVPRGGALALVGESGSGKTMTASAVAGLLPRGLSASGSVRLDDEELLGLAPARRRELAGRQIGYVFQEPMATLHPILPVGRQLSEALAAHLDLGRRERMDRVEELLDLVGLTSPDVARQRIGQLSGGMCQRVMIALAIACGPGLLIADEPTTALDVTLQRQILELIGSLRERLGLSLLMISHDLAVVSQVCEQIAVMYGGQVLEAGPTADVLSSPQHPYTRALIESVPRIGNRRRRLPTIPTTFSGRTGPGGRMVETSPRHWVRQEVLA